MPLHAPKGEDFQKATPGTHMSICYQIIDLGTQKTTFQGEVKQQRKIMLGFELQDEFMDDGRPLMVSSRYTLSGFKNAMLRKHLESWRAKAYTDDEFAAFDISKLLGVPAMLTLTQSDDEKYVNITSISLPPKGTKMKPLVNEKRLLILDNEQFSREVFDSLHEKLQATIASSPEYQAINSGKPVEKFDEELGDQLPF
jgi:hypothetical protein